MIVAETCSRVGQHIREVYDRREMNEKCWARLRMSTTVEKCKDLHAEAGVSVGGALRSCGATFVAVMQTAHPWERDNPAGGGRLDRPGLRTIRVE
jgi:hypothetical protein